VPLLRSMLELLLPDLLWLLLLLLPLYGSC
jgi:hypothetical protein